MFLSISAEQIKRFVVFLGCETGYFEDQDIGNVNLARIRIQQNYAPAAPKGGTPFSYYQKRLHLVH